jgi:hypothetical protein
VKDAKDAGVGDVVMIRCRGDWRYPAIIEHFYPDMVKVRWLDREGGALLSRAALTDATVMPEPPVA